MSNGYVVASFVYDPYDSGDGPTIFAAITLEDFDVGKAAPQPFHLVFLASYTKAMNDVPGSSIAVYGTASMTGSAAFNKALSQQRADNIARQMVGFGLDKDKIAADKGVGQIQLNQPAGVEDYQARAVSISLTCPVSSADALRAIEARWNADPLQQLTADPAYAAA